MEYLYAAIALLLSPTALLALILYTLATFITEWSGAYLAQRCRGETLLVAAVEHLYIPWLNLLALALFLFSLQPQIFGAVQLTEAQISLKRVADITLFISLILPLIPGIGRAEFALPVQGIIIVTLLFRAIDELPAHINYWPGWSVVGVMISVSLMTIYLGRFSAAYLGEWLDKRLEYKGFERALQHGIQLTLQAPVIMIYAMGLGAQI